MQKITACLWFNGNAEDAVNFYVATFKNAEITQLSRYNEETAKVSGKPAGEVMSMSFTINGERLMVINGGDEFSFTPAISLLVECQDQTEIDHLWQTLSEGGVAMQCGWLTDPFGVTWQIVPAVLNELINDENTEKSKAVTQAMLQMTKLDIAALQAAYDAV